MHRLAFCFLLLAACDSATETEPAPPTDPLVVSTEHGPVRGEDAGALRIFRGIPYAAPPLGPLRFAPPAAPAAWTEPLETIEYGPACPQDNDTALQPVEEQNEDCLTLNVYAHDDTDVRPVMVFIHGGGLVQGASSLAIYEGTSLATAGDIVLVTINYRIGALGFLATEALSEESGDGSAGNYGLRDQIRALEWVQHNISAFGGNPENVTIFGESAGGVSVCAHLGSPMSAGLFHRAIIQSGGGCYNFPGLRGAPLGTPTITRGEAIAAEAGCDGADQLECLRGLEPQELMDATIASAGGDLFGDLGDLSIGLDGVSLVSQPYDLASNGGMNEVPVITGANANEMSLFTIGLPIATEAAYEALVRSLVPGALGDQLLALYPASDFPTPKDAYHAVASDVAFVCPAHAFAEAARAGEARSYGYHFAAAAGGGAAALGAFHGLELFYLFDTFAGAVEPAENADAVTAALRDAWTTFARDGAPDASWPAYDGTDGSILVIDEPPRFEDPLREGKCAALRDLGLVPN